MELKSETIRVQSDDKGWHFSFTIDDAKSYAELMDRAALAGKQIVSHLTDRRETSRYYLLKDAAEAATLFQDQITSGSAERLTELRAKLTDLLIALKS